MGNTAAKEPAFWNSIDVPDSKNDRWISQLLDDRSLTDMSIPGTHQSMANAGLVWSWCQSLPLNVQLNMGIRFFDIHLRHLDDQLPVYHAEVFQNANLVDALAPLIEFLDAHTFEVIVVKIREEIPKKQEDDYETTYNRHLFSEAFQEALSKFPAERFWTSLEVPTLGQARGKIVLIQEFFSKQPMFIQFKEMKVSDDSNIELGEKKWEVVRKHLKDAIGGSTEDWYLTFSSAKGGLASPSEIAHVVNAKIHSFVCGRKARFGIIAMDYPGPELVKEIIDSNF